MPDEVKLRMQEVTVGSLYELWGLTEGVATIISPDELQVRPRSVGRPILGSDFRIIDLDGQDITFQGVGEIVGYSGALMSGYWNRPDANEEIQWLDSDGRQFIRTGDIGEFDTDGFLTLRGRAKDMIISGGLNVFPVDIELTLLTHSDVIDVAVVGVPHDKWGETPVAFVVLRPDSSLDKDSLRSWVNDILAKYQRVGDVVVADGELERNVMGKILKDKLVARYLSPTA